MNKEVSLKKHSAIVQINCNELTIIQRKLINAIIWVIQTNPDKLIYETGLSEVKKMCGIQATDNVNLKHLFKGLRDISIEFNYLNKDKHHIWESMSFLSAVEIDKEKGRIRFEMPEMLKQKIRYPYMYAPLNMLLIAEFKCSYTIILYELLRDYLTAEKVPLISIEDYRVLMGIKDHEYKRFVDFRNYVIIPAVEELNEKSDLTCRYELIKKPFSNKYESIQFYITKKEILNITGNLFEKLDAPDQPISKVPEEIIAEIPEKYRISSLFEEINKKVKEGKAIDYIRLNLRYAFKKAKENPLYYAINALNKNYAGFDIEIEAKKAKEKKAQSVVVKDNESQKKREEIALDIIRSFPPEKYDALYDKAKELNAKEHPGNPFFIRDSMIEMRMAKIYMENSENNSYQNNDND
ncbi:MAG: replication initiation protein [Patescibacteria group bacterium]|jgi:plasmid replication initiation protein|nr:replication initiation protein [Patescibacteria group bacterium]